MAFTPELTWWRFMPRSSRSDHSFGYNETTALDFFFKAITWAEGTFFFVYTLKKTHSCDQLDSREQNCHIYCHSPWILWKSNLHITILKTFLLASPVTCFTMPLVLWSMKTEAGKTLRRFYGLIHCSWTSKEFHLEVWDSVEKRNPAL